MRLHRLALVCALLVGAITGASAQPSQSPPTPPPASVVAGSFMLSVSNTGESNTLPAKYPYQTVTYFNKGSKDAYCGTGPTGFVATTSNNIVTANTSWSEYIGSNTVGSCITGGSDTTSVVIYQANGAVQVSVLSGGGGGGGGGSPCVSPPSTLQYDSSGSLGCVAGATSDGTNTTFTSGTAKVQGSGSGKTSLASANTGSTNYTATLPPLTDTIAEIAATQTLTNKTIDATLNTLSNIPNVALANSSMTIGGQSISLGGSTSNQGNGSLLQLATGGTVAGDIVTYDSSGNVIDSGNPQPTAPGSGDLYLSNGTNSPGGLAPSINNDCAVVSSSTWTVGSCTGGLSQIIWGGTTSGSANAYTITVTGFTLTAQNIISATINVTNTATSTLNANSLGAIAIKKQTSNGLQSLVNGELIAGNQYYFTYRNDSYCTCFVETTPNGQHVINTALSYTVLPSDWANGNIIVETGASKTITFPLSSTLSPDGGVYVAGIGNNVTFTPNSADTINGGTTGANATLTAGCGSMVNTTGSGAISATNLSCGPGALPLPTTSTLGGLLSQLCSPGLFLQVIPTTLVQPSCVQDDPVTVVSASQNISTADFNAHAVYVVTASSVTLTFNSTANSYSANGSIRIITGTNAVTLRATATNNTVNGNPYLSGQSAVILQAGITTTAVVSNSSVTGNFQADPVSPCIITGSAGILSNGGSGTCTTDTNATLSAGALSLGASGTAGSVSMGNATTGTVTLQPVTGALGTVTASLPANTGTISELNFPETLTAVKTFNDGDLSLAGSSSGAGFLHAPAAASTYAWTMPAGTTTLAGITFAQSWTALQQYGNGDLAIVGTSTGYNLLETANTGASNFTDTFPAYTGNVVVTSSTPAQGDIVYFNGSGQWVDLTHGTSGQCLQSGGAAANPSWGACASGAAPVDYGYGTTPVYGPPLKSGTVLTAAVVAGTTYWAPFWVTSAPSGGFTRQIMHTGATASGTCDLGVYAASNSLPTGSAIFDVSTGTLTASSTFTTTISWTPTANTPYYEAMQCSAAIDVETEPPANNAFSEENGFNTTINNGANTRISQTGSYGTPGSSLPTVSGAVGSNANEPVSAFGR